MIKTKIKKAFAVAWITAIAMTNFGNAFAATNIGTAGVEWDTSFETNVVWDDNFPGTATWSVNWIEVNATVLPTLNMNISASEINLGNLIPWVPATWNIGIEVGTNAANGVTITARSNSGGLVNASDPSIIINDLNNSSYTFKSVANAIDSTISWFETTGDLIETEVNNNTTEHLIYETNKPERLDEVNADLDFTVTTEVDAEMMAWNYKDLITFTVTGNF